MLHIAILTGGPSAERGISLKSAGLVERYLDTARYHVVTIMVDQNGWFEKETGAKVDLNDFSLVLNGKTHTFDFVFLIIHGTPAEDGKIQGYFEMLGIPHSTCNTLSSALTFDKQKCKDYLRRFKIPMARSVLITKNRSIREADLAVLGLPVFVKPNKNGSSYGISKVTLAGQLQPAIDKAFQYDDEVLVEAYLDGREFSCGLVRHGQEIVVFPVTEIIPAKAFFDYEAKYEGASQEITPAEIPQESMLTCQEMSRRIYQILGCKGMVRMDYILTDGIFHLLEVNTVPGLSEASILPQQAVAHGWTISQLLDVVIEDALLSRDQRTEKHSRYV